MAAPQCRGCKAAIRWITTPNGKHMPVDPEHLTEWVTDEPALAGAKRVALLSGDGKHLETGYLATVITPGSAADRGLSPALVELPPGQGLQAQGGPYMTTDHQTLRLDTVAEGAAVELFNAALGKVLDNVEDPNTDHKVRRKIVLEFVFSSDEERQLGECEVRCSTKLAGIRGVKTVVFYGTLHGRRVAVERPTQRDLFPTPHGRPQPVEPAAAAGE